MMTDLKAAIPLISRARAYRLYDYKGNRFIDMYQNNGNAILGHRSNNLTKVMKNVISRGQVYDIPSVYTQRLLKSINALFPGFKSFRIYSCIGRVLEAAAAYLEQNIRISEIYDPAISTSLLNINLISYWRPFLSPVTEKEILTSKLLIPVLPFSIGGIPQILCFREKISDNFMPSSIIAPFILAGTIRALADIKNYIKPEWNLNQCIDKSHWIINNIYISAQFNKEQYIKVFNNFLAQQVLLSPFYPGPSIMPPELSPGEVKKIQNLFLNNSE